MTLVRMMRPRPSHSSGQTLGQGMGKILTPKVLGLLLAAAILQSPSAPAASFKVTTDPKKTCSAIEIEGEIKPGDYEQFVMTLKEASAVAPLRRFYLNSPGGNIVTTLAIAEVIRNTVPAVETIVQSRQACNSACVVILSVGARRNVSADAQIIVHQAFDARTGKADAEFTKRLGQYLALNGMPPDVMWTMGNLSPEEQLAITPSNAKRLGFGSFNFYGSTAPPATPHCSWEGLIPKGP